MKDALVTQCASSAIIVQDDLSIKHLCSFLLPFLPPFLLLPCSHSFLEGSQNLLTFLQVSGHKMKMERVHLPLLPCMIDVPYHIESRLWTCRTLAQLEVRRMV